VSIVGLSARNWYVPLAPDGTFLGHLAAATYQQALANLRRACADCTGYTIEYVQVTTRIRA
jgi:enamine deaminase RidA (YjgF/YER057c/UK114 family)